MRQSQRRPFAQHQGQQLKAPPYQSAHFQERIFPIMTSHFCIVQPGAIRHLADLEGIARAQDNLVPASPKFPDDRLKKWDMWRIVEIDPYPGLPSYIPGGGLCGLQGPGLHK